MESHQIPNIQSQDLVKLKSKCNFEFGGGGGGYILFVPQSLHCQIQGENI